MISNIFFSFQNQRNQSNERVKKKTWRLCCKKLTINYLHKGGLFQSYQFRQL